GVPEADLEAARTFQRRAQFLLDFVEAENSTGFHAPQESVRVLSLALDYARQGQMAVRPLKDRHAPTPSPIAAVDAE
ncbi:MAG: ammonia-forming cytochrome c nitrite reductase subunit c552, partial [Verrucomicrobia bacterium]